MAKDSDEAKFAINLEGNLKEVAKSDAEAMIDLRARIGAGVASIREMNGSLRNLKGASAEVVAAKTELRARILAEQQALSTATLASLKAAKADATLTGASKKLADEKKKLANATEISKARTKALGAAVSAAGGPVASLRDRVSRLSEIAGEGGAGGKLAFLVLGVAGITAAMATLGGAVLGAVARLGRFVFGAADAARSAALLREAAMGGNAQWGRNFGEQVDALSKKVPTARTEIDKLGRDLTAANIGGQIWVDSLNAITQASAALGDSAGAKIKSFIDRAMMLGRPGLFRISPQELIGTGVTFQEVAESYGASMHMGVERAKKELYEGRAKLADGAKAMRDAVEKKFGGINLRQMLSLDVMVRKLGETFDDLTKGINLEPMLKGLKEMAGLFDLSTQSGQAMKQIVKVFGNDFSSAIGNSTSLAKDFLYTLILGAQDITIAYLKARIAFKGMIGPETLRDPLLLKVALDAGKVSLIALGVAATAVGAAFAVAALPVAAFALPFVVMGSAIYGAIEGVKELARVDWKATGSSIIDGLVSGITAGWDRLKKTVNGLADGVKNTFRDALQIRSPSKVFAELGEMTTAGYEQGLARGSGGAQGAVAEMVSAPAAGGGRGAGGGIVINLTINASGGGGREVAAQVSSASVIEQITKALVDALHGAGVPAS